MNSRTSLFALIGIVVAGLLLADLNAKPATAAAPDGKALFAAKCAACHQASGLGGGPYPPLAGNPDVVSDDSTTLIVTVLNGRNGPISVNGTEYGGTMPTWRGKLTNAEIAAVLTYVRSAWTNKAAAVSEDQVAAQNSPTALSGPALFVAKCAMCHQSSGRGTASVPPLAGNPDVTAADPKGMIATIVNGRSGPLTVNGKTYNGKMPTWKGQLSDVDIAAVATFVRSAWGNKAPGVTEAQVSGAGPAVSTAVGESIFAKRCSSCHGASGQGGGGGTFPALAGDKTVTAADPTPMLMTIQHGRSMMPSWKGQLSASDIAAVATYVRSAWGNGAGPVTEADVTAIK